VNIKPDIVRPDTSERQRRGIVEVQDAGSDSVVFFDTEIRQSYAIDVDIAAE
jgi:hypothetical protein